MDFFADFNNFQKEIFKNIFLNPSQNQSKTDDERKIKQKSLHPVKAKLQNNSPKQVKQKRRASSNYSADENYNLKESVKLSIKLNKSETKVYFQEKTKSHQQLNIYETPRKSFLKPQNEELIAQGVRRGRSKYRVSCVGVINELPEKVLNEMCQEEFLYIFGLRRML